MKRIITYALIAFVALFVLAGCGKSNDAAAAKPASAAKQQVSVEERGTYTDKDHVVAYIHAYKKLPSNYITKKEAQALGWKDKGTLDTVAPGKSIGGDRYGNYEKAVPDKQGRTWRECDIDYVKGNRGAKRIVYSNDGLIYYSADHYKDFQQLY